MSLLDDFEVINNKIEVAIASDLMNKFICTFMGASPGESHIVHPKLSMPCYDLDINVYDIKKALVDYYTSQCSANRINNIELIWDVDAWLKDGCDKVYIGVDYLRTMMFTKDEKIRIKFKLFDAAKIIPNRREQVITDTTAWSTYTVTPYKNLYRGYKIFSICNSNAAGWIEFNMDNIMKWYHVGFDVPYNRELDQNMPCVYRIIPFGWDKQKMGENIPICNISHTNMNQLLQFYHLF